MRSRLELQTILESIMEELDLTPTVYFQPPDRLNYPCILYNLADENSIFADNLKYEKFKVYEITVIDKDPDTEIPDMISELEYCEFTRYFVADNLNHYVYRIYF